MSDFLSILTHGRRLQAAVKEMSVTELEEIKQKLDNIIEKKREVEAKLEAELEKKKETLNAIRKQLEDAGLDISDLQAGEEPVNKKKGQKRPVKYVLTDAEGNEHPWTGIGRMPRVYVNALESGKSLDDFSV